MSINHAYEDRDTSNVLETISSAHPEDYVDTQPAQAKDYATLDQGQRFYLKPPNPGNIGH